jgi:hypothetical protein
MQVSSSRSHRSFGSAILIGHSLRTAKPGSAVRVGIEVAQARFMVPATQRMGRKSKSTKAGETED